VLVFSGAEIRTGDGQRFAPGTLVVRGKVIVAVGPAETVPIPQLARVIDAAGKVIVPGLVDTHSHVGILGRPGVAMNIDGNEISGPLQSQLRAVDAIWPGDPGIRMATAGGITTANIMPGSGNLVGGQTAYVKLRGDSIEEMLIRPLDGGTPVGGMKLANGENPKRLHSGKGRSPGTRMAILAGQRKHFLEVGSLSSRH
jgi:imidazolonepropionase-like amidohydrolase